MDFAADRSFNGLYVVLDLCWLIGFASLLWLLRRRLALVVGLAAGLVYFGVDFGLFHLLLGTRTVTGAHPALLLGWLSLSYGLTNFAWIWLLLDRDGHALGWSLLPIAGWLAVALLSQTFGQDFIALATHRGTRSYHAPMIFIGLLGYAWLALRNRTVPPSDRAPLGRLLAIGIGVQMSWETVLLLGGIRPFDPTGLAVRSLIETNLGLPWAWWIHRALDRRWRPDLRRRLEPAGDAPT